MTPAELRSLVAATREHVYLNTATYGPAPDPTVAAMRTFLDEWSRGVALFMDWEVQADECRTVFARLLDVAPADVAIQPFVSSAMGMLAVQLDPGERVVVSELEFISNLWPWLAARERGVEVAIVPVRGGRSLVDDYAAAAAGGCAVLAVSAMQSRNGWRAPLADLAHVAHDAGGFLVVDGCQGAGALALSAERDGFDVLVTDSYKWLLGPRGMGYMYIAPAARERFRPLGVNARSARDPHSAYYGVEMDLSPDAQVFDSSLSWISTVGDRESLKLLDAIGVETIERHDLALAARFRAGLARIGIADDGFPEAERSPTVAIGLGDAEEAVGRLRSAGVVAARRGDTVRFSFHVFNDESDVDRALDVLSTVRR